MQLHLKKQLPIAGCLYIGSVVIGYVMGWTAPVIPKLHDPEDTPLPNPLTDGQSSWVGSVLFIGNMLGPYISGFLSNRIGRKPCLILGGAVTLLAFIFQALAINLAMVLIGRILSGIGIGILNIVTMVYLGEIASTNIRGILLTVTGIFMTFGALLIYSVGPFVSYATTSYVSGALTVVYIVGLFFIPETPVFQVLKGDLDTAKAALIALGREKDVNDVLNTELKLPENNGRKKEWSEIFTERINRKTLFIILSLGTLQQLSGIIAINFFATSIFQLAGSSIEPNIATIILGVAQLCASCVTPLFIEKAGRKTLLLISTGVCSLSLAVLGVYFYLENTGHPAAESLQWLPLVSMIIALFSYITGFGILPGTLMGEMFLPNVRSTGSTFALTVSWFIGFWSSTAFNYMMQAFGGDVTFWFHSCVCALAFLFTLACVPETKGKSLFEIHDLLDKKSFLYVSFK